MPWKVAGNHLVIVSEAADGKFEMREYNSFKGWIEAALERCETLKEAGKSLQKYAELAKVMTEFNSLTERQQHFEHALREARHVDTGRSRAAVQQHSTIQKTAEVGR